MTSTNGQNQSEKHKKLPWWLIGTAIVCAVLALAGAITAFMFRGEKWPETLIISLLVIAFGIPFLLYMDFDEIGLFGLSAKRLKEDIKVVQQRQLMNQSVTTVDATGQKWFWVDEYGKAHKLQDEETALFLARGSGIKKARPDELEFDAEFPLSIKSATSMHHENDMFILYNDTLYYQSTLGYLYKLATWQGRDFKDKKIENWEWLEPLKPEHFIKYRVA